MLFRQNRKLSIARRWRIPNSKLIGQDLPAELDGAPTNNFTLGFRTGDPMTMNQLKYCLQVERTRRYEHGTRQTLHIEEAAYRLSRPHGCENL